MSELTNMKKILYRAIENKTSISDGDVAVKIFDYNYTSPIELTISININNIVCDSKTISDKDFIFRYTDFGSDNTDDIICDVTERLNISFSKNIKYFVENTSTNIRSFYICVVDDDNNPVSTYNISTHIEIKYGMLNDISFKTVNTVDDILKDFNRNIDYIQVENIHVDNIESNNSGSISFGSNPVIINNTLTSEGAIISHNNIVPNDDNIQNIGSNNNKYNTLYCTNINSATIDEINTRLDTLGFKQATGKILFLNYNGDIIVDSDISDSCTFNRIGNYVICTINYSYTPKFSGSFEYIKSFKISLNKKSTDAFRYFIPSENSSINKNKIVIPIIGSLKNFLHTAGEHTGSRSGIYLGDNLYGSYLFSDNGNYYATCYSSAINIGDIINNLNAYLYLDFDIDDSDDELTILTGTQYTDAIYTPMYMGEWTLDQQLPIPSKIQFSFGYEALSENELKTY